MKQIILLLLAVVLFSCGKGTLDNAENAFGRYVATGDSIVYAGNANVGTILKKSDYESEPKIKALIDDVVSNIGKAVDLNQKVYFAISGSLDKDVKAAVFFNIKSDKEFSSFLKKNGFSVEKEAKEKISYSVKNDQFVYFTDKYCVMYFGRKVGGYVKSDVLALNKKLVDASKSTNDLVDLSQVDGDIVLIADLLQTLKVQKDAMRELSDVSVDKLEQIYRDTYNQIIISSEKGYLDFTAKLIGGKDFKKYFEKGTGTADVNNLGAGPAVAGLAVNVDSKKLAEYLNTYLPGYAEAMLDKINKSVAGAYKLGDSDLSKFTNGSIALTVTGDFKRVTEGVMPEVNGYIGYGSMTNNFNSLLEAELQKKGMNTIALSDKQAKFSTKENGFSGKTIYPSYVKDFGKEIFTMFIDVQGIGLKSMGGIAAELDAISYLYATGNVEKSNLRIYMKDEKTNFLKSALQVGIKVYEAMINPYADYDDEDYYDEAYDDEY